MARCNKCGSGLAPRCAARAALDLKGAEDSEASASDAPRGRRSISRALKIPRQALAMRRAGGARSDEQQLNNGERLKLNRIRIKQPRARSFSKRMALQSNR